MGLTIISKYDIDKGFMALCKNVHSLHLTCDDISDQRERLQHSLSKENGTFLNNII